MSIGIQYLGQTGFHFTLSQDTHLLVNPSSSDKLPDGLSIETILLTNAQPALVETASVLAKQTGATIVGNAEICAYIKRQLPGLRLEPLNIGGKLDFNWGSATMVLSAQSSVLPDGSHGGQAAGFILSMGGHKIYHSGNTGLFGELRFIGEFYKPNITLLPVGGRLTLGKDDIIRVLSWLGSDVMIPMINTSGDESETDDIDDIRAEVDAHTSAFCKVLLPGETWELARAESSGRASGPESRY